MKRPFSFAAAAITALTLSVSTAFADTPASGSEAVTRGEFFKQVADHLKLAPKNGSLALPADVAANSAYSDPVRALIERHIIDGYPDGTFRLDQAITEREAGYVLARFLGLEDGKALEQLQDKFGVQFGGQPTVSAEEAANAIRAALANDAKAVEWMEKSREKQAEIASFTMDMQQKLWIDMKQDVPELSALETSVKSTGEFHKDKGLHTKISMSMPIPGVPGNMELEQYITPEGTFMKMPDPTGKEAQWYNLTKQMPLNFQELMRMQQESVALGNTVMNELFFYRDLGTETVDGKTMRKIGISGKIHSFEDIMKAMSAVMQDQNLWNSIADTPGLEQMSLSMSGTIWLDEQTLLADKMELDMSVRYGESDLVPIEQIRIGMTVAYKNYNGNVDIALPAEAKNAPELPVPGNAVPGTQSGSGSAGGSATEPGKEPAPAAQ